MHFWSNEELDWLRKQYKQYSITKLVPLFNEHFKANITSNQIKGAIARYKIRSGRTGRFKKGQKAWNKGMKGLDLAGENGRKTQFKKGVIPPNYRPVGSERVTKDGYVEVKIKDPRTWKSKHHIVWEKVHGPVPKGYALIFGDGNKQNCDLDNLILISRKQLVRLNQKRLLKTHAAITKTTVLVGDIQNKVGELRKKQKRIGKKCCTGGQKKN